MCRFPSEAHLHLMCTYCVLRAPRHGHLFLKGPWLGPQERGGSQEISGILSWTEGLFDLDKLLNLSEPPHPPQLSRPTMPKGREQARQRQGWCALKDRKHFLKSSCRGRARPGWTRTHGSSASQQLGEVPMLGSVTVHLANGATSAHEPLCSQDSLRDANCPVPHVPTPPWHRQLACGPLPLFPDNSA